MHGTHSRGWVKDSVVLPFLFKAVDAALVYSALFLLSVLISSSAWAASYNLLAIIASLLFVFIGESAHLYRSWRGVSNVLFFKRVLFVWGVTVICLITLGYLTKNSADYSRVLLSSWFFVAPASLLLWRVIFKSIINRFRRKGYNSRKVAVLGINQLSEEIVKHMDGDLSLGLSVEGLYDDRANSREKKLSRSIIGCSDDLVKKVQAGSIDLVYITLPMKAEGRIREVINKLSDTTATVYLVPDIYTYQLFNGEWTNMAGHPVVSVFESPFLGVNSFFKRLQDVIFSTVILLLISPALLIISIAVKTSSVGPVIFKQRRYGVSGEEINVWKFRSMTTQDNGSEVKQATKDDVRITPLGGFLRRTSLDELPQFLNVLRGDMSIVGPRPHAVAHNELYRSKIRGYMLRHAVKPGITGWAQINGWRGETDQIEKMEGRIKCDLWYISNWSSWLDLKIIFLTIFKGFVSKNSY